MTGGNNTFVGVDAGATNTTGSNNTGIGAGANVGAINLTFATAIGAGAVVNTSNTMVLGTSTVTVKVPGSLNVAGAVTATGNVTANAAILNGGLVVSSGASIGGLITLQSLGSAGSTTLCRNASGKIATCSSSLRYKTEARPFLSGLEIVNRLRPITFIWKQSGERDLGLAAEDVAAIEPLLVTNNRQGQIEGVKYDRISVALINAIKRQQEQIKQQQSQIDSLKKIVCQSHPKADLCESN